ncbi:MAG: nitric-oxide reductase large subunit [Syntrophorhabdales bacterium]
MQDKNEAPSRLSPWWRNSVILVLIVGFGVLIWVSVRSYVDAPPIPARVVSQSGETIFTHDDILAGQEVFLKYGLMENGTIWGHGAYLGPDFSAEYLHTLAVDVAEMASRQLHGRDLANLTPAEKAAVYASVQQTLKENRYSPGTGSLIFTPAEQASYLHQIEKWKSYFSEPLSNRGLTNRLISDPRELERLTAFFAWTAWASVANRPGKLYSYTNNFPYDPVAGNTPSRDAFLWSALSLITLLAGTALILFAFGKFNYLGWKGKGEHIHPDMLLGHPTESQKATIKYFVIVALLFLAQTLVGGATAHYRADPGTFYGFDLTVLFPTNVLRTWHLQLAIFWIATAYIAGGLFLASALGREEPGRQVWGINILFFALVLIALGSLVGELLGVRQILGKAWFWFGHQGWEYLDLGRAWQFLLAAGLLFWVILVFRGTGPTRKDPKEREIVTLFLLAALAIPLFYLPALFFNSTTHYTVVDNWRFWIIHLWVEGFFELFVTTMVAVLFYKLGMVTRLTATRVIYLDAILFLGSGVIGTGHHWYWTGQSNITMALAALFSAMEVIPLTLLTLDAWDFIKLTHGQCDVCGRQMSVPYKWAFYFLMAVGVWNFIGAGIFGFLINLPIVSYFEVGTILTPNHAHAAMMGVFGMLAVAFMVFAMRQVLDEKEWGHVEKYVALSFWGLNVGLALMVILNLFPGGLRQLWDVLTNGYWHARGPEYLNQRTVRLIEWLRMPADSIFIIFGVIPLLIAVARTYGLLRKPREATADRPL